MFKTEFKPGDLVRTVYSFPNNPTCDLFGVESREDKMSINEDDIMLIIKPLRCDLAEGCSHYIVLLREKFVLASYNVLVRVDA